MTSIAKNVTSHLALLAAAIITASGCATDGAEGLDDPEDLDSAEAADIDDDDALQIEAAAASAVTISCKLPPKVLVPKCTVRLNRAWTRTIANNAGTAATALSPVCEKVSDSKKKAACKIGIKAAGKITEWGVGKIYAAGNCLAFDFRLVPNPASPIAATPATSKGGTYNCF